MLVDERTRGLNRARIVHSVCLVSMPRREALGDVRADEAGATGERDARPSHAGGRASSIASRFSDTRRDASRLLAPLAPVHRKRSSVRRRETDLN